MRTALAAAILSFAGNAEAQGEPPPPPPAEQPPQPQPPTEPPPAAGGLEAPPPIDPQKQPPPTETEKQLEESKEKDSERGLSWFYIEAEGGYQHVGLETFEVDESALTAGFVETTANGGYLGAALGARIFVLTIGPRFRVGFFPDWQLFSVGGEIGLRFQIGIIEPFFTLGAGYTALGNFADANSVSEAIAIRGADGRVLGGVDFFVTEILAIGVGASWEFLALTRPGIDITTLSDQGQSLDANQQAVLSAEGSGYGSAFSIGARIGLHF